MRLISLKCNCLRFFNLKMSNLNQFSSGGQFSEIWPIMSNSNSTGYWIAQRYVLGIMGFLGVLNAYMMRVVLSVAITAMTLPVATTNNTIQDTCPSSNDAMGNSNLKIMQDANLFRWSEEVQGLILSSFYWGYILTNFPGGIMAERFGGKYVLGVGILSTALLTLITPMVVKIGNWPWLIVLRIFVGLGEGTTFPALNVLLSKWVPLSERATLGTLVYAGAQMGIVVGNAASGIIIGVTKSWESVFYIFGVIGILWFILWTCFCYSTPDSHPFLSVEEKQYLASQIVNISNNENYIPWKAMLTSIPLWALVITGMGYDWGLYTMITDLPKYMKSVLKFDVEQSGVLSSIPYLTMWITSMISAWICDLIINRAYVSITFARKFFTTIGMMGAGAFLLAASYAECNRLSTVTFFIIAMGFMGVCYCGIKVNALDLSPKYAGTTMALVNTIGTCSGILAPYIVGALTEYQTVLEWRTIFWITYSIFVVTNFIFLLFGNGEEQWWNYINAKSVEYEVL